MHCLVVLSANIQINLHICLYVSIKYLKNIVFWFLPFNHYLRSMKVFLLFKLKTSQTFNKVFLWKSLTDWSFQMMSLSYVTQEWNFNKLNPKKYIKKHPDLCYILIFKKEIFPLLFVRIYLNHVNCANLEENLTFYFVYTRC